MTDATTQTILLSSGRVGIVEYSMTFGDIAIVLLLIALVFMQVLFLWRTSSRKS